MKTTEKLLDEYIAEWNRHLDILKKNLHLYGSKSCPICGTDPENLKNYIQNLMVKADLLVHEQWVKELKIGDLRQWLNEERITDAGKMITDNEIKIMLGISVKTDSLVFGWGKAIILGESKDEK